MLRRLLFVLCVLVTGGVVVAPAAARDDGGGDGETVNVAAAISLRGALADAGRAFEAATGRRVRFTFGSSGQLAAQAKAGAPIDLLISAAAKPVDDLIAAGAADAATRAVVAGNVLVLIAPPGDRSPPMSLGQIADPGVDRIAIGDPATVPAGQYARQALERLALWDAVKGKVVYGTNVRAVLDLATRGEVRAAIVYATDAAEAGDRVRVVATFDPGSHEPIVYVAVVTRQARSPDAAAAFAQFLRGAEGRAALAKHGFAPPPAATAETDGK